MPERIYLDCNATAPLRPAVREVMLEVLSRVGNPSSVHAEGRAARAKREAAREAVAAAIGARPSEIIFTSGGTEANALGLLGAARRSLLVSAGEHPSVLEADRAAELVPLRRDGRLDCAALAELLDRAGSDAVLLSVQLANNETGVIQPMAEVVEIARSAGAMIHCDAIQAMGKIAVDVKALGVDFLSLSAHKMGGPQGVGALWVADGHELQPLQRGGGQELRRRAGTENLPGIVGFGKAAELALSELEEMAARRAWRDAMEQRVLAAEPQAQILGLDAPRLPNTSCLASPRLNAELQLMALDLAGFAVSTGSACSSGRLEPSHVLKAMGVEEELLKNAIRVSFGWSNVEEDLMAFTQAWLELHQRRSPAPAALV